ncbi:hypothetical protein [Streptomyces sp. AS02]|uniref:hypothetical protein n=1 Tax=Streptomyces sp. AS02 TaxID=2938946 RepID=UPI0020207F3F|nr:hypothetical protein [Streptomyces sp. AS02]MCL8016901.1 hypothetical protein [Streptomyces sp. AS02]
MMAKTSPQSPHVRLRYLPGDRRLHITDSGYTTSGYLAEASVQGYFSAALQDGDPPTIHIELEESEHNLYMDGTDAAKLDIRANRILVADVQALRNADALTAAGHTHPRGELHRLLQELRPWMQEGDAPPCGHEDVIETPQMGDTQTPGVCVWCPTPLVKLNDQWIPA